MRLSLFYLSALLLCANVIYGQFSQKEELPNWKRILVVQKTEGLNTSSVGFKFLENTRKTWKGWLVPLGIGIHQTRIRNSTLKRRDIRDASVGSISLGYTGFRRLQENLYLNVSLNIALGSERIYYLDSDSINDRFIIGTAPNQSIFYIPKSKYGFVASVGLYEKLLSAKTYTFDIGLLVNLGFKF